MVAAVGRDTTDSHVATPVGTLCWCSSPICATISTFQKPPPARPTRWSNDSVTSSERQLRGTSAPPGSAPWPATADPAVDPAPVASPSSATASRDRSNGSAPAVGTTCLLYTSDAADDLL